MPWPSSSRATPDSRSPVNAHVPARDGTGINVDTTRGYIVNRGFLRWVVLYALVLVATLYIITPFVWVVSVSLKYEREATQRHWIPHEPTLKNFALRQT